MISGIIPSGMKDFFSGIIDEVYGKSAATVSLSALVTLWTSGKGFMALKTGMQAAIHADKKKGYVFLRFLGAVDAVVFLFMIVMALALGVCGQMIEDFIESRIDFRIDFWDTVLYSALFSLYLKYSPGFENMYGSLTVIIGIMLWFYGCMYLVLLGLEINVWYIENKIRSNCTDRNILK